MIPVKKITTHYNILVKNKPGELAKLTKFLSDANMNVSGLQVTNLGGEASIKFSTHRGLNIQEKLRKQGLRAIID